MNVELVMNNAVCVGKKEGKLEDGGKYWSINIAQNDEAGRLPCDEDVYNQVERFHIYSFGCRYRDGQFKGLRVISACETGSLTGQLPAPPNPPSEPMEVTPAGEEELPPTNDVSNATGGKSSQSTATKKGK